MNARQKAKKYKELAEKYSDDICLLKTELKFEQARRFLEIEKQKHIAPLKVAGILPDYIPEDIAINEAKRKAAIEIGEFILEHDLAIFDIDKVPIYGDKALVPKFTAYLEVLIPKRNNYVNEKGEN